MARTEVRGGQILDASVSLTADVTGILPAANGGTGANTLTANAVLLGNGTGALQTVAAGSVGGKVLRSNGTIWQLADAHRAVAITYGATITPNADTTDLATTTLTGNPTIAAPTGTPADGQRLMMRFRQDGTGGRTIGSWNAIYVFGPDVVTTTWNSVANMFNYVGFMYCTDDSKWHCLAFARVGS